MVDLSSVSGWLRAFVGVRVVTDHLLAEPLWVASSPAWRESDTTTCAVGATGPGAGRGPWFLRPCGSG